MLQRLLHRENLSRICPRRRPDRDGETAHEEVGENDDGFCDTAVAADEPYSCEDSMSGLFPMKSTLW